MTAPTKSERPNVFDYQHYRSFLHDFLGWKEGQSSLSRRQIAQRCGINSPNYLQRVIAGDRNLGAKTAEKIAAGLSLNEFEGPGFVTLVRFESAKTAVEKNALLDQFYRLGQAASWRPVADDDIFSSWLHGVIFELASIPGFNLNAETIRKHLRPQVSIDDINASLTFLLSKQYILALPDGTFRQGNVIFSVLDKRKRSLDVQKNHLQYLDLAKHRISDSLDRRCFHGLTLAIPYSRFETVQAILKKCIDDIRSELGGAEVADDVMRVQIAAFFLGREALSDQEDAPENPNR